MLEILIIILFLLPTWTKPKISETKGHTESKADTSINHTQPIEAVIGWEKGTVALW